MAANAQIAASKFRERLRQMQDKRFGPSRRELLGLCFDMYEMFMIWSEDEVTKELESAMGSMFPPGAKMFKVSEKDFDEIMRRDKKQAEAGDKEWHGGKHAYL